MNPYYFTLPYRTLLSTIVQKLTYLIILKLFSMEHHDTVEHHMYNIMILTMSIRSKQEENMNHDFKFRDLNRKTVRTCRRS